METYCVNKLDEGKYREFCPVENPELELVFDDGDFRFIFRLLFLGLGVMGLICYLAWKI